MAVTSKTPASRKSPAWALPVLTGLTDGTLPPDAFAFYLCQDALYLGRYAQALAVLGGRAPEAGAVSAQVTRLQRVGFEVRVELSGGDTWVQLTRGQSESLALREGATVWLRPVPNSTSLAVPA